MDATGFVYAMRAPRIVAGKNRVGETCAVILDQAVPNFLSKVRFSDGAEATVSRWILRRLPEGTAQA